MKVNYVLMYGVPYVRYKEFETFEDISKFLVHKGFVNYSIFKKLEDKEEIEMIYRDNDIHYLENLVKKQDKEIERLNNIINELEQWLGSESNFWKEQQEKAIKNGWLEFGGKYNTTIIYENALDKLQELKGVDKE